MNRESLMLGSAIVLGWWAATAYGFVSPTLLPSPQAVVGALVADVALWWPHLLATLGVAFAGFALGFGVAITAALAMDRWRWVKRALYPWLLVSQMVPIIFVYPLLLVWMGFGVGANLVVVALMCFFPLAVSFVDGLARTPQSWTRLLRSYRATQWQQLYYLRIPFALPAALSGLRISATYCVMAAVIGEWMGARSGLGVLMLRSYQSFNTPRVFASVVLVVALSIVLVSLVNRVESYFVFSTGER